MRFDSLRSFRKITVTKLFALAYWDDDRAKLRDYDILIDFSLAVKGGRDNSNAA